MGRYYMGKYYGDLDTVYPEKFKEGLKSEDASVRMDAAEALGSLVDDRGIHIIDAIPALMEALGDDDARVRANAAWALGKIGVPSRPAHVVEKYGCVSVVPALIDLLEDEDAAVIADAAGALGNIVSKMHPIENVEKAESMLKEEVSAVLVKKDKDKRIRAIMGIAKVMKKIAERKSELVSKRDILLDGKPKPPERGTMYQRMRIRNC